MRVSCVIALRSQGSAGILHLSPGPCKHQALHSSLNLARQFLHRIAIFFSLSHLENLNIGCLSSCYPAYSGSPHELVLLENTC